MISDPAFRHTKFMGDLAGVEKFVRAVRAAQKHLQVLLLVSFIGAALVAPAASVAQNLGAAPATGQAVQGQTASQPEGAFLNAVNWVCNVICHFANAPVVRAPRFSSFERLTAYSDRN